MSSITSSSSSDTCILYDENDVLRNIITGRRIFLAHIFPVESGEKEDGKSQGEETLVSSNLFDVLVHQTEQWQKEHSRQEVKEAKNTREYRIGLSCDIPFSLSSLPDK